MSTVLPLLGLAAALALIALGLLLRARDRDRRLAELLELPWGERDVDVRAVAESHAGLIDLAAVERRLDRLGFSASLERVRAELERARIALRPAELVGAIAAAGLAGGTLAWLVTGRFGVAVVVIGLIGVAGWSLVLRAGRRRAERLEAQLPEALSIIASSLRSGHSLLRATELLATDTDAPLREELDRVLAETRLGVPLVDALDHLAARMRVEDLEWVVQAVRMQARTGGRLADVLGTVAEFMRAREEVRREVRVLTAEGRLSAWVLSLLPLVVLGFIWMSNPDYLEPMRSGWPLVVLIGGVAMAFAGLFTIRRMAEIEV